MPQMSHISWSLWCLDEKMMQRWVWHSWRFACHDNVLETDAEGHEEHTRLHWAFILTFDLSWSNPMQSLTYKSVCLKYCCFRLEEAVILNPFLWQVNFFSLVEWSQCISVRLLWTFWCKGPITALTVPKTMYMEPRPRYCCCCSAFCWPSDTIGQRKTMCQVSRVYLRCCLYYLTQHFLYQIHYKYFFWTDGYGKEEFLVGYLSYHAVFCLFSICSWLCYLYFR